MEYFIAIVLTVVAAGAGLVFAAAGIYSVVALVFDELLESDRSEPTTVDLGEAA